MDFYVEDKNGQKGFIEVKGVALENYGIVSFQDALTERGTKHLQKLVRDKTEGFHAYILFVIQISGMKLFIPNDVTHRAFSDAFRSASKNGVNVLAYECKVTPETLDITNPVSINLKN